MIQIIKDSNGDDAGIFIPIRDWEAITQIHKDLRKLTNTEPVAPKRKLSELAGKMDHATAEEMQKYVVESRNEWEERWEKQF